MSKTLIKFDSNLVYITGASETENSLVKLDPNGDYFHQSWWADNYSYYAVIKETTILHSCFWVLTQQEQ